MTELSQSPHPCRLSSTSILASAHLRCLLMSIMTRKGKETTNWSVSALPLKTPASLSLCCCCCCCVRCINSRSLTAKASVLTRLSISRLLFHFCWCAQSHQANSVLPRFFLILFNLRCYLLGYPVKCVQFRNINRASENWEVDRGRLDHSLGRRNFCSGDFILWHSLICHHF